jgi:hypothetical protein
MSTTSSNLPLQFPTLSCPVQQAQTKFHGGSMVGCRHLVQTARIPESMLGGATSTLQSTLDFAGKRNLWPKGSLSVVCIYTCSYLLVLEIESEPWEC